jgi:glycerol-3-phosphate dehydrogenase
VTTHRAMAEDTINAVQERLGAPKTQSLTRNRPLAGADRYTPDYRQKLVREQGVSDETAHHLVGKFGTAAEQVLDIARRETDLSSPILNDLPQLRAEVAFCARHEMAVTIEDVLFRRLGIQLYSWRSAIHAAPVVASILARELGWSGESTRSATRQYVEKINRYLQLAGLAPEPFSDSGIGSISANVFNAKGR